MAKTKSTLQPKTEQHVLKSLRIVNLKGVRDLFISFEGSLVTGIFGLNGCGKTTILQAIVSLYRDFKRDGQYKELENTKMSRFFKQTDTTNKWAGSKYIAGFSYFDCIKKTSCDYVEKTYARKQVGKIEDNKYEWTPRQARKLQREVCYIPLSLCLPDIEKIKSPKVTYQVKSNEIECANEIAGALTTVFNKKYTSLKSADTERVKCFRIEKEGINCHSFSLGAGEQRVERILRRLYCANKYTLVVIDELDLTIHTAALKRLLSIIVQIAENKKLQVIFTSHRQELMSIPNINVRYIHNSGEKAICINEPSPLLYNELTGDYGKVLHIYVEDMLARAVIAQILQDKKVYKNTEIHTFGSIESCCSLAVGIICQNNDASKTMFVCHDGDNEDYVLNLDKHMNQALTGDDEYCIRLRQKALSMISCFDATFNENLLPPEKYICESILELPKESYEDAYKEIYDELEKNRYIKDHHDIINNLIEMNIPMALVLKMFIKNEERWKRYISKVEVWLDKAIKENNLNPFDKATISN